MSTPSIDERREVADGLRRQVKRLGPQMDAHEFAHYGADVIDPDNELLRWDQMMLRLADLIEPEPERTCHIDMVSSGAWECDVCGGGIDWDSYDEDDPPNCNYCPNCGAKVMAD